MRWRWPWRRRRYNPGAPVIKMRELTLKEAEEFRTKIEAVMPRPVGLLRPVPPPEEPPTDYRHLLNDDTQPWTTRSRLAAILRRPHLATTLVDQLDKETAAVLADQLETLVSRAVRETQAEIERETADAVDRKIAQIESDRRRLLEEVTRERFGTTSRLG